MMNRKKASQIKDVTTIIKNLKAAGLRPTFHILDNEVSTDLIAFLEADENITVQLAPARCHRINAEEREIRTFKNHFIAGLCTAHKHFPLNKCDSLLPQAVMILNLLRTLRLDPKLSAHALLNGLYDFNATPMAPLGSMILVHENPPSVAPEPPTPSTPGTSALPFTIIGVTTYTLWRRVGNASPTQ